MKKLLKLNRLLGALVLRASSVVTLALFTCNAVSAGANNPLQQVLDQRINQQQTDVGIVVGILSGGQEHYETLGKINAHQDQLVNPDTLFEIGSISKTFTSLLLADMVIKGEVQLHDRVSQYLPDSVTMPSKGDQHITLRHLATHSSGLPRLPDNMKPANLNNPYADYTEKDLYQFLSAYSLNRDIGAEVEYSNLGMGLLGHVLTLITGMDYESLLRQRILAPLEMHNTKIKFSKTDLENAATGHDQAGEPTSSWDIPTLAGAGAIRSSAKDMMKYLKLQMGLVESDLKDAVALTHQFEKDYAGNMKMGLAWIKSPSPSGEFIIHDGGTGGFASFIGFNLSKKEGVVVLGNARNEVADIGMTVLAHKVEKLLKPAADKNLQFKPELLAEYTGDYQLTPELLLTISKVKGQLFAQATGQGKLALEAISRTEFANHQVGARMVFLRDENKQVNRMTFSQGGTEINALKRGANPDEAFVVNVKPAFELNSDQLKRLTGPYRLAPGADFTITSNDKHLYAQFTGQSKMEIYALSEMKFDYRFVDAKITFVNSESGHVDHLILHQNGDHKAMKVK